MIHYLIIGHACDEEPESRVCIVQGEQPNGYLEKKFIKQVREDWDEYYEGIHLSIGEDDYVEVD